MAQNYGLGRGLSSLIPSKKIAKDDSSSKITEPKEGFNYFGNNAADEKKPAPETSFMPGRVAMAKAGESIEVNIGDIMPNPYQPRKEFDQTKLNELADSIKAHGIIQPIVATKKGEKFEIVAGERRLQAAKVAGLEKVPVLLRKPSNDQEKLEMAIVENIQRQDLSPIEEAKSYLKLVDEFSLTQEEVAKKLGKSRSVVANKIRLLNLPEDIQKALVSGKITEGHCKLLLAIPNPEKQKSFFELIIKNNLTVRQTDEKTKEVSVRPHKRNVTVDPEIKNVENQLAATLGTKVKLTKSGDGGKIVIEYYSKEELNNILSKIK